MWCKERTQKNRKEVQGKESAAYHEVFDDAVEGEAVVVARIGEVHKVRGGDRHLLGLPAAHSPLEDEFGCG